MKKMDMVTYLTTSVNQQLAEYAVVVDWDKRNHTIELVFRLYAENTEHAVIDDVEGTTSEEEIIEFEDGILFYHPQKSKFDQDDYLVTFPYDGKKGIQQAMLDGIVDYLKLVLEEGQIGLIEFLTEDQEEFSLVWDNEVALEIMNGYLAKDEKTMVPYPSY